MYASVENERISRGCVKYRIEGEHGVPKCSEVGRKASPTGEAGARWGKLGFRVFSDSDAFTSVRSRPMLGVVRVWHGGSHVCPSAFVAADRSCRTVRVFCGQLRDRARQRDREREREYLEKRTVSSVFVRRVAEENADVEKARVLRSAAVCKHSTAASRGP